MQKLVMGVDFGSDSVRVSIVDANTGESLGSSACEYPRWMDGKYSDSSRYIFRQHPKDYLEAFEVSVTGALQKVGADAGARILAMAIDTTGSTPVPVDRNGTPLALLPEFAENPDAMFYMWKDHSAIEEAKEINHAFSTFGEEDYTRFQGTYSSEWYWAKILHASRTDPKICEASFSWVEHSDWIPAILTGNTDPLTMYRNACAAGHKALWHSDFGGLPSLEVLGAIDPYLAEMGRNYGGPPRTADTVVGTITPEWAQRLGLNENVVIGGSSFDAHAGAVGAGIRPGTLVKVVGTSTVDMLVETRDVLRGKDVKDICGQAENSIIPGYIGIESGQAAFGDVFSWYRNLCLWPVKDFLAQTGAVPKDRIEEVYKAYYSKFIGRLEEAAAKTEDDLDLIAIDWFNGRRYPQINESVKGMFSGLTLGVSNPQLYRALALSTVFGSRRIFDTFVTRGLKIDSIIMLGGIAKKSPLIMQMMADVLKRPIKISKAEESCAKGAAIYAAVAAGLYPDILEASKTMSEGFVSEYLPDPKKEERYNLLYRKYLNVGRHEEQIELEHACLKRKQWMPRVI